MKAKSGTMIFVGKCDWCGEREATHGAGEADPIYLCRKCFKVRLPAAIEASPIRAALCKCSKDVRSFLGIKDRFVPFASAQ